MKLIKEESGQAVLETAVTLPVVLMLIMIGITVSLLIYSQIVVTLSAANGARYGATIWRDKEMTQSEKEEKIKNASLKMVEESLTGDKRRYSVTESNGMLTVTVEYDYEILLPFANLIFENHTLTIKHASKYYIGSDN